MNLLQGNVNISVYCTVKCSRISVNVLMLQSAKLQYKVVKLIYV